MGRPLVDLTNKKYGKLTVLRQEGDVKNGVVFWLCLCSCGNQSIVSGPNIRGGTKSCGCSRRKHGHSRPGKTSTPTYTSWLCMRRRCSDQSHDSYPRYGGRGITVCKRWQDSFIHFLEDMGEKPANHEIDRIDGDKGYYLENCRWVLSKTNNRNKQSIRMIEHKGRTQCLAAWAEESGIKLSTLYSRLYRLNWSVEKALEKKCQLKK